MSRTTSITGVAILVGIPVTDQDRALEFYVGQLGFEALAAITRRRPLDRGRPAEGGDDHRPCPRRSTGIRLTAKDADTDHAGLPGPGRRHRPRGHADPERAGHVRRARPDGNGALLVEGE